MQVEQQLASASKRRALLLRLREIDAGFKSNGYSSYIRAQVNQVCLEFDLYFTENVIFSAYAYMDDFSNNWRYMRGSTAYSNRFDLIYRDLIKLHQRLST